MHPIGPGLVLSPDVEAENGQHNTHDGCVDLPKCDPTFQSPCVQSETGVLLSKWEIHIEYVQ